jgi:hypothetical protein
MTRMGRKPLATGHVDRLQGSEPAKQRLAVLLETLHGVLPVPEACERLGIGESRFHALRGEWLQEALELLEPRPLGRPPQPAVAAQWQSRIQALEAENRTLRQQLAAAEVRRELAEVLPHVVHSPDEAAKKGAPAQRPPKRRRPH